MVVTVIVWYGVDGTSVGRLADGMNCAASTIPISATTVMRTVSATPRGSVGRGGSPERSLMTWTLEATSPRTVER